jgi:hypothetical protein
MRYQLFQSGQRVCITNYGPFRGLVGTVQLVDTIASEAEPWCFYLIELEGAQTTEPLWFEREEVESVSAYESDHLQSA